MTELLGRDASTVGESVDRVAALLSHSGHAEPRREALRLVADLLETSTGSLFLRREEPMEGHRLALIEEAALRLAAGEPLAYVTGVAGFRRLTIKCDRRALIPRPETEGLVDLALELAAGGLAVDVGTGSGCLALALKQEGSFERVVGIDRSPDALSLADENRRATGIDIHLVRSDFLSGCGNRQARLIVSNPPYISSSEYLALPRSVSNFEPRAALESKGDGLAATLAILREGRRVLEPGGWVVMELAAARAALTGRLAVELGWSSIRVEDDVFGRPRYLVARWGIND